MALLIIDKKAENVAPSIYEEGATIPLISRDIKVLPNRLDHFVIPSPDRVVAYFRKVLYGIINITL